MLLMANLLEKLRKSRGLTLQRAAQLIGTSYQQLRRLELGKRRLTIDWARRIADAYGVDARDLIAGSGPRMAQVLGYVGAGEEVYPIDDLAHGAGLEEVEAPVGAPMFAVRVKGDSMAPRYDDGDYLFYDRDLGLDGKNCVNRDCVVKLRNGRMVVKRVRPGTRKGRLTLLSFNPSAEIIQDAAVEWCAPIRHITRR
jgi:transcriptional regulator with XRE-family HTH domain